MSFRTYVKIQQVGGLHLSHFLRGAQVDPDFPDAHTWEQLRSYLSSTATELSLKEAHAAWSDYQALEGRS
jgi:hypothetical protein